jgi:YHS domain-containing protein
MIIRVLIAVLAIYLLYRIAKGLFLKGAAAGRRSVPKKREGEDMVEDPYCHVYIPVSESYAATIDGRTRHFCSRECYEKFISEKGKG